MLNKILILVICLFVTFSIGCADSSSNKNGSSNSNIDAKNLPNGIEAKEVKPDGKTTPGIPDPKNANLKQLKPDGKKTPGIPDPKTIGKTPVPKGATPTPGIPSPEELKKMRERKVDPNEVNKSTKSSESMSDETPSSIDRKRRAGKASN